LRGYVTFHVTAQASQTRRLLSLRKGRAAKEIDDSVDDALEQVRLPHRALAGNKIAARSEESARSGVTGHTQ